MRSLVQSARSLCLFAVALIAASCGANLAIAGGPPGDDWKPVPYERSLESAVMPRIESTVESKASEVRLTRVNAYSSEPALERPAVLNAVRTEIVVGGCTGPNCPPSRTNTRVVVAGGCSGSSCPPSYGGGCGRVSGCGSSGCRPSYSAGGCSGPGCVRVGGCGGRCR